MYNTPIKSKITYFLKVFFIILLFVSIHNISTLYASTIIPAKAIVMNVENEKEIEITDEVFFDGFTQKVHIKILTTKHRNKEFSLNNPLEGLLNYDNIYKVDDILLVNIIERNNEIVSVNIRDYYRINYYYILLAILIFIIIIYAGKQGIKSFLALFILTVLLFLFTKYIIIENINPIIFAILFSLAATLITFYLITKDRIITYASIAGSLSGLFAAFIISLIFGYFLYLDKFQMDIYREILMFSRFYKPVSIENILLIFNLTALISAVGIVMDVSITISSSIREISLKTKEKGFKKLFNSGMNIGKDIFGTMANVYILIFTGHFLPMLLFVFMMEYPILRIINTQFFISDVTIIISGLIGMVVSITVSSIVASYLCQKK